jgi:hypothetical protein
LFFCRRNDSLTTRFIKLRGVAFLTFFLAMAKPSLGRVPLLALDKMVKNKSVFLLAPLKTVA